MRSHRISHIHRTAGRRPSCDGVIPGLAVVFLLSWVGPGFAQTVDTTLWVTNYAVSAVVRAGGNIYIGGSFTQVGPSTGCFVTIDATTAVAAQPYARVAGFVYAVAPDGSGGWYLGGSFTAVRGEPRGNLAHLDASGNLTAWNPNANSTIYALAVSEGTVYASGAFTTIGGATRNRIAALDTTTGAATSWDPNANSSVYALAVSGGTVYAGGQFVSIGGKTRYYIAALDAASGAATSWNPSAGAPAHTIAVSGTTVYAGGEFAWIGGQSRRGLAALDATTGAVTSWSPNANFTVSALAVSGGTVYAGGDFWVIGGATRTGLAALDAASGAAGSWDPNAGSSVYALAVSGGTVYAGGWFRTMGGQTQSYIAALSGEPATDVPFEANRELAFALARPNPFRGQVSIDFNLPEAAWVRLEVVDVAGRRVWTAPREFLATGRHSRMWSGQTDRGVSAPSGVYFLRVTGSGFGISRSVVRVP